MLRTFLTILALASPPLAAQASVTAFGASCLPPWSLTAQGLPQLGTTFTVSIQQVPCGSPVYAMLAGFTQISAPVSLPQSGVTCTLLVSPDVVISGTSALFVVPNQSDVIGFQFHVQAGVVGFSCILGNPFGIDLFRLSDGMTCTVGP